MEYKTVCINPECNANWYKKLETEICPLCGQKTIVYTNYDILEKLIQYNAKKEIQSRS